MSHELHKISEGIWAVGGNAKMAPGVQLPLRCTIIELGGGGLFLHSPVRLSTEVIAAIKKLGEVRFLMAPNLFHHLFMGAASEAFPQARVLACPGLQEKCPNLTIHKTVEDELPADLQSELSAVFIRGAPRMSEIVLFHERSKTLLVTDYFFNVQQTQGMLTPLMLKMFGTYKKPTQSKLWRKMTKDRDAMKLSAEKVLAHDYRRVIMCHGEIVEDGREFTRAGLAWLAPDVP